MRLSLIGKKGLYAKLSFLLQTGVVVHIDLTQNIRDVLYHVFSVEPAYVEEKIKTVFVNGRPVDDIDAARLADGDLLALSAAMPGLVGAAMRRGGLYAPLRSTITYSEPGGGRQDRDGRIKVRLFNTLIDELGPLLFGKGVLIESLVLKQFLSREENDFWVSCKELLLDDTPRTAQHIIESLPCCTEQLVLFYAREEA